MIEETVPVRLTPGSYVRLHGQRYIVGGPVDGLWHFSNTDGTHRFQHTTLALRQLMRKRLLTSEASHAALTVNVRIALTTDWGAFTVAEQTAALAKHPYVKAIDELPLRQRDKRKYLKSLIDDVQSPLPGAKPSFRLARAWYIRWVAAGRDIRALVDFHRKKGNRTKRLPDWIKEEIEGAIDEVYDSEIRGSEAATWRRARDRILLRAKAEGLVIPPDAKEALGKNAIGRALAHRQAYQLIVNRFNRGVADQLVRNLGVGPAGDWPLSEAEVDHTPLDLVVLHDNLKTVLGRPHLTVIIDRYSRMILGFALTFAPPSWVSVMEALAVAVQPKDEFLASLGGNFRFEWDVFGVPDSLFNDNGREFRSASMKATEAVLNMRIIDVGVARGDLKGKIEAWLKKNARELIHTLPGTTFFNTQQRGDYDSVANACLTLTDAKWIVAKYIVDIYNQTEHPQTKEIPAERWKRGMLEVGEKPPPPKELIAPLTGLVVSRKLRRSGVSYNCLRWNSNEFQALRNRLGVADGNGAGDVDVLVRIDPLALRVAYVLDEENDTWIEGQLLAETEVEKLTYAQYQHIKKTLDNEKVFDDQRATKIAQAAQDIRDRVMARTNKDGVVPKREARFVTEGRKPSEHVHQSRFDPDESERPVGSHDAREHRPKSPAPDARGPWRERVLRPPGAALAEVDQEIAELERAETDVLQNAHPPAAPTVAADPAASRILSGRRRQL